MSQLRLFTAVDLPDEIIGKLADLVERLRPLARINWSKPANFHITTKFIGTWPESRLADVVGALRSVPRRNPIPVRVAGLSTFRHSFFAGVDASALTTLAMDTERVLAEIGVATEDRRYSPHLTLARIRAPGPFKSLRREQQRLGPIEFGSFVADRFSLYNSRPGTDGSVYTKLSEFPF